jgi:hypothetical protein
MHLALGNRQRVSFRVKDLAAYERQIDRLFRDFTEAEPTFPPADTYPEPVEHCAVCRWRAACGGSTAPRTRCGHCPPSTGFGSTPMT